MQRLERVVVVNESEWPAQIYFRKIVLAVGGEDGGPDVFTVVTRGEVRAGAGNLKGVQGESKLHEIVGATLYSCQHARLRMFQNLDRAPTKVRETSVADLRIKMRCESALEGHYSRR